MTDRITAPRSPAAVAAEQRKERADRARALQGKNNRTPAELSELLGILAARVDELEAQVAGRPT